MSQPIVITEVSPSSPAARYGIRPGDRLVSLNGHRISDVLDYRFYMMEKLLKVALLDGQGQPRELSIRKKEYEDLGLGFETYLMDRQHSCKNKCIFCFVDQTPPGMRESLYFKDDDSRLSFFFGNYITLTNLTDQDIERIIRMHISPINISVHTTNPELRVKMMKNPRAGTSLRYIRQLAEAGIKVNAQLVLCPGINDGEELRRSLRELGELYPGVESIACVPVGLTDYREGLYPLRPYTREAARQVIDIIHEFADHFEWFHGKGNRLAYPADEFFLKAELPVPSEGYYGEFSQLDNGVGMLALMDSEFSSALSLAEPEDLPAPRRCSVATGVAAGPLIERLVGQAVEKFPGLDCSVHVIVNDYFGHNITVAGLVTGTDLARQLAEKELGEELLLPASMLRHEKDKFLDDMTLEELSGRLQIPIRLVENDGFQLLDALLGLPRSQAGVNTDRP